MRLVRSGIFFCERIREVGIEHHTLGAGAQEKPTLPQPPQPRPIAGPGLLDIHQQLLVSLERELHVNFPSPFSIPTLAARHPPPPPYWPALVAPPSARFGSARNQGQTPTGPAAHA